MSFFEAVGAIRLSAQDYLLMDLLPMGARDFVGGPPPGRRVEAVRAGGGAPTGVAGDPPRPAPSRMPSCQPPRIPHALHPGYEAAHEDG